MGPISVTISVKCMLIYFIPIFCSLSVIMQTLMVLSVKLKSAMQTPPSPQRTVKGNVTLLIITIFVVVLFIFIFGFAMIMVQCTIQAETVSLKSTSLLLEKMLDILYVWL